MGKTIALATPVFFALIALEFAIGRARGRSNYRLNDALNSLSLGVMSKVVGLFTKLLAVCIYAAVHSVAALWQWPTDQWWTWVIAIVAYDFCYYWNHRLGHESAVFWAAHVVHHQSQEYTAVGDRVFLSGESLPGTECDNTKIQLDHWMDGIVRSGKPKLILKTSDIPQTPAPGGVPGCILAIEGGDALEGNADRVDEFHRRGVRMITLIHFSNNELGDCMQSLGSLDSRPRNNGLTAAGRRVVGRMQELGMVVDVAHADSLTLKQIGAVTRRPVVDSHGNPCSPADTGHCGRFRTWKDMEAVAKTGGVVCTWTWGMTRGKTKRETFPDWAREIMEMKKRNGNDNRSTVINNYFTIATKDETPIRELARLLTREQQRTGVR